MAGEEKQSVPDLLRSYLIKGLTATGTGSDVNVTNTSIPVATGLAQPLTRTQLDSAAVVVEDFFAHDEPLLDQAGANAVLTFTFSAPVQLGFVRSNGGISRFSTDVVPTATKGGFAGDGETTAITRVFTTLSVYAPTGATVSVWGYRY